MQVVLAFTSCTGVLVCVCPETGLLFPAQSGLGREKCKCARLADVRIKIFLRLSRRMARLLLAGPCTCADIMRIKKGVKAHFSRTRPRCETSKIMLIYNVNRSCFLKIMIKSCFTRSNLKTISKTCSVLSFLHRTCSHEEIWERLFFQEKMPKGTLLRSLQCSENAYERSP